LKLTSVIGGITFISVYAPPANHKLKEKEKFYDDLTKEVNAIAGIYYIGGDFNNI
jgi:exonuclease III